MSKEKLNEFYNKIVSNHDDLTHILLILKKVIDSVDENNKQDMMNLELELMYILSTYTYNKQLLNRFSKDLKRIVNDLNIEIKEIDESILEEYINRLVTKINNK